MLIETAKLLTNINKIISETPYNADCVFNTDQSRSGYEMLSSRTSSQTSEKHSYAVVQSLSSMTLSYTIQVHISSTGTLSTRIYLCFQEPKGEFGPKVELLKGKPHLIL